MLKSVSTNHFKLLLLFAFLSVTAYGQLDSADSLKIYTQVNREALLLKKQLQAEHGSESRAYNKELLAFTVDTFKIERTARLSLEMELPQYGISMVYQKYYVGYEHLANRLYYTLKENLTQEDKKLLVNNYWKWKAYADSKPALYETLARGGGTSQNNIIAWYNVEIMKDRALELHDYLSWLLGLKEE